MCTYIRVVGYEAEGTGIVNSIRCGLEKEFSGQIDFMTFASGENRGEINKCFWLDSPQNVKCKMMLLVVRVVGSVASSVIPIFNVCAKRTDWQLAVLMLRFEERLENGLPQWTDLPEGHCNLYTVLRGKPLGDDAYTSALSLIRKLREIP